VKMIPAPTRVQWRQQARRSSGKVRTYAHPGPPPYEG
jgi:hypothetical protein